MRAPRWWRRARRPHKSELVELEILVDGQPLIRATLEQLALACYYGGGVQETSFRADAAVEITTRVRDTPNAR